jgi:hypothetical protein
MIVTKILKGSGKHTIKYSLQTKKQKYGPAKIEALVGLKM